MGKEKHDVGYVYILINKEMPGLVKIGHTKRSIEERIEELSKQTGVPEKFEEEYSWLVENPEQYERLIHANLMAYRIRNDKEFFRVDKDFVRKICQRIIRGQEVIDIVQEIGIIRHLALKYNKKLNDKENLLFEGVKEVLGIEKWPIDDVY